MIDTPNPDVPASITPGSVTPATATLKVDPSRVQAVAISVGLAFVATIGGATTILSFARDRDLAGLVTFLASSNAAPFFGGVATLAGLGGIAWRTIWRKRREVYLAYHARDRIAVVTKPIDPPKPV